MQEPPTNGIRAQVIINCLTNGQVQVSGHIDDLMFVYGLLECAKDAVKAYHQRKSVSGIVPVKKLPEMN